jgi:hypothetical protein
MNNIKKSRLQNILFKFCCDSVTKDFRNFTEKNQTNTSPKNISLAELYCWSSKVQHELNHSSEEMRSTVPTDLSSDITLRS